MSRAMEDQRRGAEDGSIPTHGYFLSLIAALTFAAMSGGIVVILCAVLACSAPFAITSASSFPSMTALHPGMRSPQFRTFAMVAILPSGSVGFVYACAWQCARPSRGCQLQVSEKR